MKNKKLGFLGRKFAKAVSTTMVLAMLVGTTVSAQTASLQDVFDANYYSQTYGDLSEAFGTDAEQLFNHYVHYGQAEERTFTMLIDLKKYREAYADLDAAFGDDWNAYLNHYLVYGFEEGRKSFGIFDARAYADRYPDLKEAFGYDVLALYQHYMTFGINEGRNCMAEVVTYASSNSNASTNNGGSISTETSTATVATRGTLVNPETGEAISNATVTFTRVGDLYQELATVTSGDVTVTPGDTTVTPGDPEQTPSDDEGSDIPEGGIVTVSPDGNQYTVTTDANGRFVIENLPAGRYDVEASAEGYMTLSLGTVAVSSGSGVLDMPAFSLLSADVTGANDVFGQAVDATTGYGIANVTLKIRSGWNNYEGDVVATAATDEDGNYSIHLERGYYTIEFAREGYVSTFVNVFASNASRSFDGTMNNSASIVDDSQLRVVLTWGETPSDLDSHLVGPGSDDIFYHIYFAHKTAYDRNGNTVAQLDVDDITSYGPETVTVFTVDENASYYYSVHDYTNWGDEDSTEMSASGANVKVYQGSNLIAEYNVPTGKTGFVWNVFKIVNGRLITVNDYNSEYDSMFGDYQNITE